jgi:predicted membrane protein
MFPLPESLSASVLVQWINIVAFVFLFIAPNRSKLMNLLVLITVAICILMIVFARFGYKRRDEDERKRLEKEEEQIKAHDDINSQFSGINNEQQQYGTFS